MTVKSDDCVCEFGDMHCACLAHGRDRDECRYFHFPAPKIVSPRARSTFLNDLRDQGETRIKNQQREGRERIADSQRKTAKLLKTPGAMRDWQQSEIKATRERAKAAGRIKPNDPPEGIGRGIVKPGGKKVR